MNASELLDDHEQMIMSPKTVKKKLQYENVVVFTFSLHLLQYNEDFDLLLTSLYLEYRKTFLHDLEKFISEFNLISRKS